MKNYKKPLIVLIVVAFLIAVGAFVYAQQKDEPVQNQPVVSKDCEIFDNKEFCAGDYIGLSEEKIVEKAKNDGFEARVVQRDGEYVPVISAPSDKRINFTVTDGIVTKAEFY